MGLLLRFALATMLFICLLVSPALSDDSREKAEPTKRIVAIENGLREFAFIDDQPGATYSIEERMRRYRVPGVSIAVIHNYKIEWTKTYGVLNSTTPTILDSHTRFQAGSLSKPITALAMMRLAKKHGIRLTEGVNRYLKSWKVPRTVMTARNPVTFVQLLNHSSGIESPWTPGYSPDSPIPQLGQILDGDSPTATPPLKVTYFPGKEWHYSNGGYIVLQQLIEDITGKSFDEYVTAEVLQPLGMHDSNFAQPPVGLDALNTAVGHNGHGKPMPGSWHIYPEKAAAGLWTTSDDMGRFLVALMQAWNRSENSPVEGDIARAMVRRTIAEFGLGVWSFGSGHDPRICHTGTNAGYKSAFHAFPARGQGVVVMTNGELGETLVNEIVRSVAAEFGWPDYEPEPRKSAPLPEKALRHYAGTYVWREKNHLTYIFCRNGTLRFAGEVDPTSRLYHARDNEFFILDKDWKFSFVTNKSGKIEYLQIDTDKRSIRCAPMDTQQMAIR